MSSVKMWRSLHISSPSGMAAIRQIPLTEEKNKNKRLQYKISQNSTCTDRGKKNHTIGLQANTQNATT